MFVIARNASGYLKFFKREGTPQPTQISGLRRYTKTLIQLRSSPPKIIRICHPHTPLFSIRKID